jgi:hypothetical protein
VGEAFTCQQQGIEKRAQNFPAYHNYTHENQAAEEAGDKSTQGNFSPSPALSLLPYKQRN